MKNYLIIAAVFASAAIAQDIDLTGYILSFQDEFNALSVDVSPPTKDGKTWYYNPPYGPAGSYSASKWGTGHKVVDGKLVLGAAYYDSNDVYESWYSEQVSSMDTYAVGFAQQYGYFSARMQMPKAGQGAWPSFWLMTKNSIPANRGKRLEIDIVEWYGNNPTRAQQVTHNWNDGGSQQSYYLINPLIPGGNASDQFHIYGALVKPDTITFYIDGVKTGQTPTPAEYIGPMYIMVAYALGGGWPLTGEPFASKGSSALLVDWVRVYSLPTTPTPTPTPAPTPFAIKGHFEGTLDGIFTPAQ